MFARIVTLNGKTSSQTRESVRDLGEKTSQTGGRTFVLHDVFSLTTPGLEERSRANRWWKTIAALTGCQPHKYTGRCVFHCLV